METKKQLESLKKAIGIIESVSTEIQCSGDEDEQNVVPFYEEVTESLSELLNELNKQKIIIINKAYFVKEITVIDPDSNGNVELSVYKHENGGMFAMDGSFLDQCVTTDDFDRPIIPDPFTDNGIEEKGDVVLFD